MTGFGDAHHQAEGLAVAVEVRTINNRYFKFTMRSGEGYAALEPQVESVVREHIKRGTVQVNLWIEKQTSPDDYLINVGVLKNYRKQLHELASDLNAEAEIPLEGLLTLPGVVIERRTHLSTAEADWLLASAREWVGSEGVQCAGLALSCRRNQCKPLAISLDFPRAFSVPPDAPSADTVFLVTRAFRVPKDVHSRDEIA